MQIMASSPLMAIELAFRGVAVALVLNVLKIGLHLNLLMISSFIFSMDIF